MLGRTLHASPDEAETRTTAVKFDSVRPVEAVSFELNRVEFGLVGFRLLLEARSELFGKESRPRRDLDKNLEDLGGRFVIC